MLIGYGGRDEGGNSNGGVWEYVDESGEGVVDVGGVSLCCLIF